MLMSGPRKHCLYTVYKGAVSRCAIFDRVEIMELCSCMYSNEHRTKISCV